MTYSLFLKLPNLEGNQAILKRRDPRLSQYMHPSKGYCHESICSCTVILLHPTALAEHKAKVQQWEAQQLLSNAFSKERFCCAICSHVSTNASRLVEEESPASR